MFNYMFWNIRGLSKISAYARLNVLVRKHKLKLLAVCEPRIHISKFEVFRMKLGFHHVLVNKEGRIAVFFTSDLSGIVLEQSDQFIAIKFTYSALNLDFFSCVCACRL